MKPALCFLPLAAFLIAANDRPVEPNDLTVHEWGTFTSVAGEDGSAIDWDALGCKNDLPQFVNDFGYRGFKWGLQGTVRMETPVMYFYSSRELEAHVKVAFPEGLITEWYPQADYAVFQKTTQLPANLNGIDTSLRNLTGTIEWKNVKVRPGSAPALPVENAPSRYYAARGTDAAPITVSGQHEKFLFYRGVGRFPVPLSARLSADGKILIENRGHEPVPSVILFENHAGRVGYRIAGAIKDARTLDQPALNNCLPPLLQQLETTLIAQGLFPKEAHAMVETWGDSWFEEGSRLIYIVPSPAVDAILPLQVEPVPLKTVRVFVGRIELVTPETKRSVESAIANNDWPAVGSYSRFLNPILQRIYSENPSKAGELERSLRDFRRSRGACSFR